MKLKLLFSTLVAGLFLTGCSIKEVTMEKPVVTDILHTYTLQDTIVGIADILAMNLHKKNIATGNIAMTSFVELNNFSKTSKFGRLLSESLFHELNYNGVNVLDFRTKRALTVNGKGEFYLSRKVSAIKKSIYSKYVLVGTYTKTIDKNLLINARIVNSQNGDIISTSSVIFHKYDCKLFDTCRSSNRAIKLVGK